MFETSENFSESDLSWETSNILKRVLKNLNVSPIDNYGPASGIKEFNFHALTLSTQKPVLVSLNGSTLSSSVSSFY